MYHGSARARLRIGKRLHSKREPFRSADEGGLSVSWRRSIPVVRSASNPIVAVLQRCLRELRFCNGRAIGPRHDTFDCRVRSDGANAFVVARPSTLRLAMLHGQALEAFGVAVAGQLTVVAQRRSGNATTSDVLVSRPGVLVDEHVVLRPGAPKSALPRPAREGRLALERDRAAPGARIVPSGIRRRDRPTSAQVIVRRASRTKRFTGLRALVIELDEVLGSAGDGRRHHLIHDDVRLAIGDSRSGAVGIVPRQGSERLSRSRRSIGQEDEASARSAHQQLCGVT